MRLGLLVEHGGSKFTTFSMRVRESYKSCVCGLCGDYNGNPDNDFTTGPRCDTVDTPGTIVSVLQMQTSFMIMIIIEVFNTLY